jgi:glycine cleavage system H protein
MSAPKTSRRDLYFTSSHDWIDFQGSVAYIGVCAGKLKQVEAVHQLLVKENSGVAAQGEIVAEIRYDEKTIPVRMPVDGKIISINEVLLAGNFQPLLDQPENNGWVALIVPSRPYERSGLMPPEQYKQFIRQNS